MKRFIYFIRVCIIGEIMRIGSFESRAEIETKSRILRLYVDMRKQFNFGAVSTTEKEYLFAIGFIGGLRRAVAELESLNSEGAVKHV